MEIIEHNKQLIALIFRPQANQNGSSFFTPPNLAMQVGFLHHKAGETIRPHAHSSKTMDLSGVCEIAIVQSGACEVQLYTSEGLLISTHDLAAGDAMVLLSGGHAFRMIEDTDLYVIKQGPHTGPENKKYF